MSTSVIKKKTAEKSLRTARTYLLAALFCAVFGAVYEIFSHEVYSFFMIYAFMIPLVLGALPNFLMGLKGSTFVPAPVSRKLYRAGIATLTVGSIMQGVLEIYGTTNVLTAVYWIVGGSLLVGSVISELVRSLKEADAS